ncbi:MAG TPA: hypothetical protein VMB82_12935, partial [Acidimicrobiales bacterium]|nr:hypothetical protein [Acidimicrobiales bacterium]
VQRGTVGRYLAAMRGSETGATSLGINLNWQRILVFALSGAVAGVGGTLLAITHGVAAATTFNYEYSLVFVVVVITTGVSTIEGAIQAGIAFTVIQYLLQNYAPAQLSGLTIVIFAFGALTYSAHPQGVLEFQKRTWTLRFQKWIFKTDGTGGTAGGMMPAGAGAPGVGTPAVGSPASPATSTGMVRHDP